MELSIELIGEKTLKKVDLRYCTAHKLLGENKNNKNTVLTKEINYTETFKVKRIADMENRNRIMYTSHAVICAFQLCRNKPS